MGSHFAVWEQFIVEYFIFKYYICPWNHLNTLFPSLSGSLSWNHATAWFQPHHPSEKEDGNSCTETFASLMVGFYKSAVVIVLSTSIYNFFILSFFGVYQ